MLLTAASALSISAPASAGVGCLLQNYFKEVLTGAPNYFNTPKGKVELTPGQTVLVLSVRGNPHFGKIIKAEKGFLHLEVNYQKVGLAIDQLNRGSITVPGSTIEITSLTGTRITGKVFQLLSDSIVLESNHGTFLHLNNKALDFKTLKTLALPEPLIPNGSKAAMLPDAVKESFTSPKNPVVHSFRRLGLDVLADYVARGYPPASAEAWAGVLMRESYSYNDPLPIIKERHLNHQARIAAQTEAALKTAATYELPPGESLVRQGGGATSSGSRFSFFDRTGTKYIFRSFEPIEADLSMRPQHEPASFQGLLNHRKTVAASEVDQLLGNLGVASQSRIGHVKAPNGTVRSGVISEYLDGAPTLSGPEKILAAGGKSAESFYDCAGFEFLIGQADGHAGNYRLVDGRYRSFDFNGAFSMSLPQNLRGYLFGGLMPKKFTPRFLNALKSLNPNTVRARLSSTLTDLEIDALLFRRDMMLRHAQECGVGCLY